MWTKGHHWTHRPFVLRTTPFLGENNDTLFRDFLLSWVHFECLFWRRPFLIKARSVSLVWFLRLKPWKNLVSFRNSAGKAKEKDVVEWIFIPAMLLEASPAPSGYTWKLHAVWEIIAQDPAEAISWRPNQTTVKRWRYPEGKAPHQTHWTCLIYLFFEVSRSRLSSAPFVSHENNKGFFVCHKNRMQVFLCRLTIPGCSSITRCCGKFQLLMFSWTDSIFPESQCSAGSWLIFNWGLRGKISGTWQPGLICFCRNRSSCQD